VAGECAGKITRSYHLRQTFYSEGVHCGGFDLFSGYLYDIIRSFAA
jgi:hypothetical protein